MFVEGHAEERVHGFGSIVAGAVLVMSTQGMASPHSAGNGGTVTEVGGRDADNVCYATWLLTTSDTRAMLWSGWQ